MDFGNGAGKSNIILVISTGLTGQPHLAIYNQTHPLAFLTSSKKLEINVWYHLAFIYNRTYSYIYVNGTLSAQLTKYIPIDNVQRVNCYIGKSNWIANELADLYLKFLNIYNKALNESEIKFDSELFFK